MAAKKDMIKITLVKSLIGSTKKQIATAESLGLRKVGSSNEMVNNAATMGKLKLLSHLLTVEEAK